MVKINGVVIDDEYYEKGTQGIDWTVADGKFVVLRPICEAGKPPAVPRNLELRQKLAETDYQCLKWQEGWLTDEEYAPIKAQREAWREEIRKLEGRL